MIFHITENVHGKQCELINRTKLITQLINPHCCQLYFQKFCLNMWNVRILTFLVDAQPPHYKFQGHSSTQLQWQSWFHEEWSFSYRFLILTSRAAPCIFICFYGHWPESSCVEQDSGNIFLHRPVWHGGLAIQSLKDHPAQQVVAAAAASSQYL